MIDFVVVSLDLRAACPGHSDVERGGEEAPVVRENASKTWQTRRASTMSQGRRGHQV